MSMRVADAGDGWAPMRSSDGSFNAASGSGQLAERPVQVCQKRCPTVCTLLPDPSLMPPPLTCLSALPTNPQATADTVLVSADCSSGPAAEAAEEAAFQAAAAEAAEEAAFQAAAEAAGSTPGRPLRMAAFPFLKKAAAGSAVNKADAAGDGTGTGGGGGDAPSPLPRSLGSARDAADTPALAAGTTGQGDVTSQMSNQLTEALSEMKVHPHLSAGTSGGFMPRPAQPEPEESTEEEEMEREWARAQKLQKLLKDLADEQERERQWDTTSSLTSLAPSLPNGTPVPIRDVSPTSSHARDVRSAPPGTRT